MQAPKKWKMAILIWLAVYPLITLIFLFLGPYLIRIDLLPLRTLVITLIAVPIMVFILIPALQKLLKTWLNK